MRSKQKWDGIMMLYLLLGIFFTLFSYFFVDANLILSGNATVQVALAGMRTFFQNNRGLVAGLYILILTGYFFLFILLLKKMGTYPKSFRYGFVPLFISTYTVLVFSYPATSYDLFNYIATAKVTFIHRENPYIVMPIDIANDPVLVYTRAANKTALYGPVWILLTAAPVLLGGGNVWITMVLFRIVTTLFLLCTTYMLYRISSGDVEKTAFFAFNPLVILETGSAGHNDIVMIFFLMIFLYAIFGRTIKNRVLAYGLLLVSILVKGVTIVMVPLLFLRLRIQTVWRAAFWILFTVFVIAAPIREELYPWYAIWFLPFAALLDGRKFEKGFAIALSIGLELRHVPYMVMGYYEGYGPMLRVLCTLLPVSAYFVFLTIQKRRFIL